MITRRTFTKKSTWPLVATLGAALLFGCGDGTLEVFDDQAIVEDVATHQHGELLYVLDNATLEQKLENGVLELRPTTPFTGVLLNFATTNASMPYIEYAYERLDGTLSDFAPLRIDTPESQHVDASITLNEMGSAVRLRVGNQSGIEFVRAEFVHTSAPEGRLHFDDDWEPSRDGSGSLDDASIRLELSRAGRYVPPADVVAAGRRQSLSYDGAPAWSRSNCTGTFMSGTRQLAEYLKANFAGARSYGGYSCRPNTANTSKLSVHGTGRAIDVFVPLHNGDADNDLGDPIANWLIENAESIGVQYFIWDRTSWGAHRSGDKHRRYTGPHPHHDHLHIELTHEGARKQTPWFNGGGATQPGGSGGTSGVSCWSKTLGRNVPAGECVQMAYAACGGGTCNWAVCTDQGAWSCTDVAQCGGETHSHSQCAGVNQPSAGNNNGGANNPPPAPTGADCYSRTLGRDVEDGACVQMNYNSCGGAGTCLWAACDDGAWKCTPVDSCGGQKFGHSDCAPPPQPAQPAGDSCWSKTLGRNVDHGSCVQMAYDACGGTCQWASCDDGAWKCTDVGACGGDVHGHASCGGGTSNDGSNGGGADAGNPNASKGTPIGTFWITYYYKSFEDDFSGADTTPIYDTSCNVISRVPSSFASSACIEGSAKLSNGDVINYARSCSCSGNPCSYCWEVVDATRFPWGKGNRNNPLVPLRSLAVDTDVISNGTLIYLEEFDGLQIPSLDGIGGFTHDGCFRADDVGGAIQGDHFDVFAGSKAMHLELERLLPTRSRVHTWVQADERCAHLNN